MRGPLSGQRPFGPFSKLFYPPDSTDVLFRFPPDARLTAGMWEMEAEMNEKVDSRVDFVEKADGGLVVQVQGDMSLAEFEWMVDLLDGYVEGGLDKHDSTIIV